MHVLECMLITKIEQNLSIIRILLSFACALNPQRPFPGSKMEAKEVEPNSGVTEQGSCKAG